jgi:simple sugar transport system ATP-binding protein
MTITPVKDGVAGKTIDLTTLNAREERTYGVAHIPEDRRGSGLVLTDTIEDNLILGRQRWPQFSWNGLVLQLRRIVNWAKRLVKEFDIRTSSIDAPASILAPSSSFTAASSSSATRAKLCCSSQPSWKRFAHSPTGSR